jgi:hypothetical protein
VACGSGSASSHEYFECIEEEYSTPMVVMRRRRAPSTGASSGGCTVIRCSCSGDVEQLQTHIASPSEGPGRLSGCREVKGKALAVQHKLAGMVADQGAEQVKKQK